MNNPKQHNQRITKLIFASVFRPAGVSFISLVQQAKEPRHSCSAGSHPRRKRCAMKTPLRQFCTIGRTLMYRIYIKSDYADKTQRSDND